MPHISWHDALLVFSFFAAIAGLLLALSDKTTESNTPEETDRALTLMIFAYWLVHCVAIGVQKLIIPEGDALLTPEWETALTSVRLTAVLSYLLTFACVLSLPLHRVSVRQPE